MAETKDVKDFLDEICPRIQAQADMVFSINLIWGTSDWMA